MSKRTIYEVELIELLPENLRKNNDIVSASKAIDSGFLLLVDEVKNITMLPRINELDEEILDHVAYFFHVDFYDRSLPLQTKRDLVKNSVYIHKIKGTPKAVELLIETVFEEGKVVEWFEYGGQPYYFKVVTNNREVTQERANEFIRALDTVKNARSYLEKVEITQVEDVNLYFVGFVHVGDKEQIYQVV